MRAYALLASLLAFSIVAEAKTNHYTEQQQAAIWAQVQANCKEESVAEGRGDSYYKACVDYQRQEQHELASYWRDDSISQYKWDDCEIQTHFNQTFDYHAYNVCLRLSKDRHDLP